MSGRVNIRSRILGTGEEDPAQLLAHPLNFRRHPGQQLEALRGSLRDLGWLKHVIVNRTTGHVLDGHARVEEALRQGLATVPVLYVDLSAEEERLALAVLDPITELAVRDDGALTALLDEVTTEDAGLQALLDELKGETAPASAEDPANEPQQQEVAALIVDCASLEQRDALAARLTAEGYSCRRAAFKREE